MTALQLLLFAFVAVGMVVAGVLLGYTFSVHGRRRRELSSSEESDIAILSSRWSALAPEQQPYVLPDLLRGTALANQRLDGPESLPNPKTIQTAEAVGPVIPRWEAERMKNTYSSGWLDALCGDLPVTLPGRSWRVLCNQTVEDDERSLSGVSGHFRVVVQLRRRAAIGTRVVADELVEITDLMGSELDDDSVRKRITSRVRGAAARLRAKDMMVG